MRGIIGALVAGLLVGCGGVEGEADAQADGLQEQRSALYPCDEIQDSACNGMAGVRVVCETPSGGTMNCRCMPGEYFYCS